MPALDRAAADASPLAVAGIVWTLVICLLGVAAFSSGELFRDSDDYMRAVQVRDWLNGAGWFDLHQARLNPPYGVDMHWTRLPDLPIAVIALLLQPLLGSARALMGAAIVVPPLLLFATLVAMGWAVRPLLPRTAEPLAILIAGSAVCVVAQYGPGRIDHHNWQLLLAILGLGFGLRVVLNPLQRLAAVMGGICLGLGSWVGLESLPWIAAACAALAALWLRGVAGAASSGLSFASGLFGTTVAVLIATVAPERWGIVACDSFSIGTVIGTAAIMLFWGAICFGDRHVRGIGGRSAYCALLGGGCLGLLLFALPTCRGGPLAGIDPVLAKVWLARVSEAQPLLTVLRTSPDQVPLLVGLPLLGFTAVLWRLTRCRATAAGWWFLLGHLVIALSLTMWQVRMATFANLFAVPAAAGLVADAWRWIEHRWAGWRQPLGRVAVLASCSFVPWIGLFALPAKSDGGSVSPVERNCDLSGIDEAIGPGPVTIAAPIDLGPKLLFETPHAVLGAPYHRNNLGNLDTYRLFSSPDEATARSIADRRAVDYVLACRRPTEINMYGGNGSFFDRLTLGQPPKWLQPIPLSGQTGAMLFRVLRAEPLTPDRPSNGPPGAG